MKSSVLTKKAMIGDYNQKSLFSVPHKSTDIGKVFWEISYNLGTFV